jgi:hypothetical protein
MIYYVVPKKEKDLLKKDRIGVGWRREVYLVDVLAGKLGNQGLNAVGLGLNADGGKEGSDVLGRGGGFTTDGEQKVGSEVLHGD